MVEKNMSKVMRLFSSDPMTSIQGVDLSQAISNRVRAQDATRAGTNSMPSVSNPGLSSNPDRDIYGRDTGMDVTMGNRASERTFAILEGKELDSRPIIDSAFQPMSSMRGDAYAYVQYQTQSQIDALVPRTTFTPKISTDDTMTSDDVMQ